MMLWCKGYTFVLLPWWGGHLTSFFHLSFFLSFFRSFFLSFFLDLLICFLKVLLFPNTTYYYSLLSKPFKSMEKPVLIESVTFNQLTYNYIWLYEIKTCMRHHMCHKCLPCHVTVILIHIISLGRSFRIQN